MEEEEEEEEEEVEEEATSFMRVLLSVRFGSVQDEEATASFMRLKKCEGPHREELLSIRFGSRRRRRRSGRFFHEVEEV